MTYGDFESILLPQGNGKQNSKEIQKSLVQTNINNILLTLFAIKMYVLMISLVSLLRYI